MPEITDARVALYSHDSTGLGHVRRNLLLAQELGRRGCDVLLLSGCPEATAMTRPPNTDLITLPALGKSSAGTYGARHLRMGLHELTSMRRHILTTALASFAPDLLVVDRHARGFLGELEPALEQRGPGRTVLGLRDVLDTPERVRKEWQERRTTEALAHWYDEVWHYGDTEVHHPLRAAGIATPVPVVSTGYLVEDRPGPAVADDLQLATDRFVLCMVGGGADGEAVAAATQAAPRPADVGLVVVTGPQMPGAARRRLRRHAEHLPDVTVVDYLHDPAPLLHAAEAAVVMGGYNTVCEVLASTTRTLVVPRDRPRLEQTIRAEAMRDAGLLDVLPPHAATGRAIGAWLETALRSPRRLRTGVALDGLARLADRAEDLLRLGPRTGRATTGDRAAVDHPASRSERSGPAAATTPIPTASDRRGTRAAV